MTRSIGRQGLWAVALTSLLTIMGCGEDSSDRGTLGQGGEFSRFERDLTRQEAFLARIQEASRGNEVILDARMNGDDELGVVLGPQVQLDQVRGVMTALLREMRADFPNRPLTVLAYAPNGQLMATLHYDPAAPHDANATYAPNF